MLDLTPLTESEMLAWYEPIKVYLASTPKGIEYVVWHCYCGLRCSILVSDIKKGTRGGSCRCGRDLNLDLVDGSCIPIEPQETRYTFPIIVDRGGSWRLWRRPSVGL